MRFGRIEEASAIAKKIGDKIESNCRTRLNDVDSRTDSKKMWDAVRVMTGRRQELPAVDGVTAESLIISIMLKFSQTLITNNQSTRPQ